MGDADRLAAQPLAAGGALAEEPGPVPGGDALRHRADDLLPGLAAHDAVGAQAVAALEAPHRAGGGALEVLAQGHAVGLRLQDPVQRLDVASAIPEVERPGAEPHLRAIARIPGRRQDPVPPEPAWALVAAATMAITAIATAQKAIRSGRRSGRSLTGRPARGAGLPPAVFDFRPRTGGAFVHLLFRSLTGLADGLAPKEMALRGSRLRFAPENWVPRSPRLCGGDSAGSSRHPNRG